MRNKRKKENRDYTTRFGYYKFESTCNVLRSIVQNYTLNSEIRIFARFSLFKTSSFHGYRISNFKNRCLLTGRLRSTLPYFKLSRIEFRRLAKSNLLNGIKKSSWLVVSGRG